MRKLIFKTFQQTVLVLCLTLCLSSFAALIPANVTSMMPSAMAQTGRADQYVSQLQLLTDRLDELKTYVDAESWQYIRTFIRGPFGQVRRDVGYVIGSLPKREKSKAKALASQFYNDLIDLDAAATAKDPDRAEAAYAKVRGDFERLVEIL